MPTDPYLVSAQTLTGVTIPAAHEARDGINVVRFVRGAKHITSDMPISSHPTRPSTATGSAVEQVDSEHVLQQKADRQDGQ